MRIKDLVKFIMKEDQKKYLIKEIGEDAAELFFRIKDCIEQESGEFLYDGEGVHLTHFLIKESLTDNWSMQKTRAALFKLEKQEYLISRKDHANHGKWYMINHEKIQKEVVKKAGNCQLYKLFSRLRVALIILIVLLLVVGIVKFGAAASLKEGEESGILYTMANVQLLIPKDDLVGEKEPKERRYEALFALIEIKHPNFTGKESKDDEERKINVSISNGRKSVHEFCEVQRKEWGILEMPRYTSGGGYICDPALSAYRGKTVRTLEDYLKRKPEFKLVKENIHGFDLYEYSEVHQYRGEREVKGYYYLQGENVYSPETWIYCPNIDNDKNLGSCETGFNMEGYSLFIKYKIDNRNGIREYFALKEFIKKQIKSYIVRGDHG